MPGLFKREVSGVEMNKFASEEHPQRLGNILLGGVFIQFASLLI